MQYFKSEAKSQNAQILNDELVSSARETILRALKSEVKNLKNLKKAPRIFDGDSVRLDFTDSDGGELSIYFDVTVTILKDGEVLNSGS